MSNEALKTRLEEQIEARRDEIVALCSNLIKIPSENPPGDMHEIAGWLQKYLEEQGFQVNTYEPETGRISVVTQLGSGSGRTLILNGHMDVVPAGDVTHWDFDPFCGEVREGKILGRGATDMKGGLTTLIAAMVIISEIAGPPPGTLILTAVPDEETGGEFGSKWLVDSGTVKGDACLIGEPATVLGTFVGEKGLCWMKLKAKGRPAHGSMPVLGENAIVKLATALPLIQQIEEDHVEIPADIAEIVAGSKVLFKQMRLSTSGEERAARVSHFVDHCSVNVGVIQGGAKINMVPDECMAEVDVRVPAGTTPEEVRDRVMELLEQAGLEDIECEIFTRSDPNYTPPTEEIYRLVVANAKRVTGTEPKPLFITGGTDCRFFRLKGIPAICYGPGELLYIHAYNELVTVDNLISATKVVAGVIVDYLYH